MTYCARAPAHTPAPLPLSSHLAQATAQHSHGPPMGLRGRPQARSEAARKHAQGLRLQTTTGALLVHSSRALSNPQQPRPSHSHLCFAVKRRIGNGAFTPGGAQCGALLYWIEWVGLRADHHRPTEGRDGVACILDVQAEAPHSCLAPCSSSSSFFPDLPSTPLTWYPQGDSFSLTSSTSST